MCVVIGFEIIKYIINKMANTWYTYRLQCFDDLSWCLFEERVFKNNSIQYNEISRLHLRKRIGHREICGSWTINIEPWRNKMLTITMLILIIRFKSFYSEWTYEIFYR